MVLRGFTVAGAVVAIAAIIVGLFLWDPRNSEFDRNDAIETGKSYKVEIVRDNWGVPHIFGKTDQDTVFGLGFAHAEDDFETIQEAVAATRGVLARYRGADAAPTDYIVSLLRVWETIDAHYETDIPDHIKRIAEAYANGVNVYAAQNPDAVWSGLAPFTARDVVAGFVFKTPFFYGLDETLLALFGENYEPAIALDPSLGQQSWVPGKRTMGERGSNAFAVSPQRSGDGVTRLLINSHQPLNGPVAWYEAHMVSETGLDITGGTFPGAPLILHGFNRDLGWANTVNKPDLVDTYALTINPDNIRQYRLDDDWKSFEQKEVIIRVGLFGPFAYPAKRTVLFSDHGPVIKADHGTYAIRYAGMGEVRQLEQYYRLNQATSIRDFINAMSMNALPSINYVYADRSGNILYLHNAQFPARDDAWNWSGDMPGDRSDLIWQGYRSYDQVPILVNPQSGFIWNANNNPLIATDGLDNLKPDMFAQSMGLQSNMTNRALRIVELTGSNGASLEPISRERLLKIKFDTKVAKGSLADEIVTDLINSDWSQDEQMARAIAHLAAWDGDTNVDNPHAALAMLTVLPEVTEPFTHVPAPTREAALYQAIDLLMTNYQRLDVPWGEVNRFVRGQYNLPIDGGPDILRAVYPAEMRDDGKLHDTAGDSWIALVEWDTQGRVSADLVHNFGSSTLDETSKHYDDQVQMFVGQKFRKALIEREDILAVAERRYHPVRN